MSIKLSDNLTVRVHTDGAISADISGMVEIIRNRRDALRLAEYVKEQRNAGEGCLHKCLCSVCRQEIREIAERIEALREEKTTGTAG